MGIGVFYMNCLSSIDTMGLLRYANDTTFPFKDWNLLSLNTLGVASKGVFFLLP